MDTLLRDLRYGARLMVRSPGFATAAIVSLGLGIGANTAIFSLLDAVLLQPMAVSRPAEIVSIYTSDFSSTQYGSSSYPDYVDFKKADVLAGLAAYQFTELSMNAGADTEMAFAETVSGSYFPTLGVAAARGRTLGEADDVPGAPQVTAISHGLWVRRFGSDPNIVGRTLQFNARPFTIVGVIPPEFKGALRGLSVDAWIPIASSRELGPSRRDRTQERGSRGLMLIGRLRPGVTVAQAQAAFTVIAAQLYAAYPEQWRTLRNTGRPISVVSERNSRVHPDLAGPIGGFMALLMVVVGLVLLTACANVANLLLARGASRAREIGVRLALGAGRRRLVRQLLTESVILAAAGGLFGVVVAVWLMRVLMSFKPPVPVPVALNLHLDTSVLVFALLLSIATGAVFGLAPALHAARAEIVPVLKDKTPGGRRQRSRLRSAFVVAQVACSMLLLVGAGLFVRSLQRARAIDLGFDPSNMVVMSLNPSLQGYDEARGRTLYDRVLDGVHAVPGVQAASLAASVPLGLGGSRRGTKIEGYQPQPGEDTETSYNIVGPQYFETMRIPVVRGRSFTAADRQGSTPVVVVNDAFANRYWPGVDPIGKRLSANGPAGPFREVVGVVRTGKYNTLGEEPRPFYYLPLLQEYRGAVTLHVKGPSRDLIPAVRDAIRAVDAAVPVFDAKTMEDQLLVALLPARLAGTLLGAFGILALLLAAVGIYGVMAYSVAQRTREIGVRMALGAGARDLLRLVVGEGARLTAIGLVIGLAVGIGVTRFIASLLYGITPTDVIAFGSASAILATTALLASYIPARRAIRVDPVLALRRD